MTIEELSRGIEEGKWTCRDLVQRCLKAIAANDSAGRKLNSVAEINADVFFEADRIDAEIREKGRRSPLHGVPVLLKDNIDIRNMHTTAGSLALSDLIAEERLLGTLAKYGADCLLSCGSRPCSNFAPISGNPCLSLPACEGDAENWQACSYYLMAGPFREDVLLHTAYILEQRLLLRCCPEWAEEF